MQLEAVKSCLLPFLTNFFCTPVKRPTTIQRPLFISPEGSPFIEVGLYSLTNQCYFSLIYKFWKLEISIKQCWFCCLSISSFCVRTFAMFKQLLTEYYWHPKIENVNLPLGMPALPLLGQDIDRYIINTAISFTCLRMWSPYETAGLIDRLETGSSSI